MEISYNLTLKKFNASNTWNNIQKLFKAFSVSKIRIKKLSQLKKKKVLNI